ncbi:unnamed protein product [Amoebophrya sp. A120]|nr:unnamed protein product [Amoebophrya sp. A120]|eukprot:GSA120T00020390001.1
MLKTHKYCEICRDEGELDIRCCACGGAFHAFCYAECYDPARLKLPREGWTCEPCHNKYGETFCHLCNNHFDLQKEERKNIQKCPGCAKQVHVSCAQKLQLLVDTSRGELVSTCQQQGLQVKGENVMYVCHDCTKRIKMKVRRSAHTQHGRVVSCDSNKAASATNKQNLLHQAFCEVCQKGGKLLLCDTCPKSYHATCIEHLVSLESVGLQQEWRCPVCTGIDLYNNPDAVRLSEHELSQRLQLKNQHNMRRIKWVTRRRNAYLNSMLHDIEPFVSKKILKQIKDDRDVRDRHFRMGDVIKVTPDRSGISAFAFKKKVEQDLICEEAKDDDPMDVDGEENSASAESKTSKKNGAVEDKSLSGHAVWKPFVGTVLEESSMSEDDSLTVVDHADPETIVKVKPYVCQFLCSGSQRRLRKFHTTPPDASVFLSRTKNGVDFLAEGVKLKDYQVFGVDWITNCFCDRGGCILADDMGLGKTLQALAFLANLHHSGNQGPHLVVVPYAVVGNWIREVRRFCPQLRVAKLAGGKNEWEFVLENNEVRYGERDLYITTYETLVSSEPFFASIVWSSIILDEAHRIKNQVGRVRQTLAHVETSFRLLLTGTPLQNNIQELFVLLNYLWPDVLQDSKSFEEAISFENVATIAAETDNKERKTDPDVFPFLHQDTISKENQLAKTNGFQTNESLLQKVRGLLERLMLRRTKAEVLRLPPKHIRDVWLPLAPAGVNWARLIYRCHDELQLRRKQQNGVRQLMGLLLKIRIICCHPKSLLRSKSGTDLFSEFEVAKRGNYQHYLQQVSGEMHLQSSNKMMFLDKLLTQLYCENVDKIPLWEEKHKNSTREQRPICCAEDDVKQHVQNIDLYADVMKVYDVDQGMMVGNQAHIAGTQQILGEENVGENGGDVENDFNGAPNGTTTTTEVVAEGADGTTTGITPASASSVVQLQAGGQQTGSSLSSSSSSGVPGITAGAPAAASSSSSSKTTTAKINQKQNSNPATTAQFKPHKIILFTQFQMVLDELEAYCKWRNWKYLRLDGTTNKVIRELDVKEFNSPDSHHLIFLMSTRAGGVGINLQSANFVCIYDQDWNPHIDTQAMDRAHRIGQDRPVTVYRMLTEWTVEERLAHRCEQKMNLNKQLLDDDLGHEASDEKLSMHEVLSYLRHGRQVLTQQFSGESILDKSIPNVLERTHQPLPMPGMRNNFLAAPAGQGQQNPYGAALQSGSSGSSLPSPSDSEDNDPQNRQLMTFSVNELNGGTASDANSGVNSTTRGVDEGILSSASSASGVQSSATSSWTRNNTSHLAPQTQQGMVGAAVAAKHGGLLHHQMRPPFHPPPGAPAGGNSMMFPQVGSSAASSSSKPPNNFGLAPYNVNPGQGHPGAQTGAGGVTLNGQQQLGPLPQNVNNKAKPQQLSSVDEQIKNGGGSFRGGSTTITNDQGVTLRRSTRIKRQPQKMQMAEEILAVEVEQARKKHIFNFKYDRICFACKEPVFDAKGNPIPIDCSNLDDKDLKVNGVLKYECKEGEPCRSGFEALVCERCPKTFHAKCQGVEVMPKKFVCSWHECLCCRRRAGDVGGMLVQCTGCPKAYCIDCFPQSFRRVYPEDSFFKRLQAQGWDFATRERMVNFECNDCRVRREFSEKKALDLEEQRKKERELNEIEKKRLRDEKKQTEKQSRLQAKEEQEKLRLAKEEEDAALGKAMKKLRNKKNLSQSPDGAVVSEGGGTNEDAGSSNLNQADSSAVSEKKRKREEQKSWVAIREKMREKYNSLCEKRLSPELQKRIQMFREDYEKLKGLQGEINGDPTSIKKYDENAAAEAEIIGNTTEEKSGAYHQVSKKLLKQHLFDLYYELEENITLELCVSHLEFAKKEQVDDPQLDKTRNFVDMLPLCRTCYIPGHKQTECPLGADWQNLDKENTDKKARKQRGCTICGKTTHGRRQCPDMSDEERKETGEVFAKLEKLMEQLEEVKPVVCRPADDHVESEPHDNDKTIITTVSYLPAYDSMHLDECCKNEGNRVLRAVILPMVRQLGLEKFVLHKPEDLEDNLTRKQQAKLLEAAQVAAGVEAEEEKKQELAGEGAAEQGDKAQINADTTATSTTANSKSRKRQQKEEAPPILSKRQRKIADETGTKDKAKDSSKAKTTSTKTTGTTTSKKDTSKTSSATASTKNSAKTSTSTTSSKSKQKPSSSLELEHQKSGSSVAGDQHSGNKNKTGPAGAKNSTSSTSACIKGSGKKSMKQVKKDHKDAGQKNSSTSTTANSSSAVASTTTSSKGATSKNKTTSTSTIGSSSSASGAAGRDTKSKDTKTTTSGENKSTLGEKNKPKAMKTAAKKNKEEVLSSSTTERMELEADKQNATAGAIPAAAPTDEVVLLNKDEQTSTPAGKNTTTTAKLNGDFGTSGTASSSTAAAKMKNDQGDNLPKEMDVDMQELQPADEINTSAHQLLNMSISSTSSKKSAMKTASRIAPLQLGATSGVDTDTKKNKAGSGSKKKSSTSSRGSSVASGGEGVDKSMKAVAKKCSS